MRKNRVAIGATILLALLALTVWAINNRDKVPSAEDAPELPSIDTAAVTSMEITRPGEATVVLTKTDDVWHVTAPIEAEADKNAAKTAADRLGNLKSTGVVATNAENHARLDIGPEKAVKVVAKAGDNVLATLRVGKYSNGKTMVRRDEEATVHGVSGSIRYVFDRDLKNWRNRKVVDVSDADVQSVTFEHGKQKLAFERGSDGTWGLSDGQKPIKDFDPKKVAGFVSTAARLTASDFATGDEKPETTGLGSPSAIVKLQVQPSISPQASDGGVPTAAADGGVPDVATDGSAPNAATADGDVPNAATTSAEPSEVVLQLGGAKGEAQFYLQRQGDETVYLISKYLAERLRPTRDQFEKSAAPAAGATPTAPPVPTGAPGQTPKLPPEIMKQLQEQLKAQGQHP